MEKVITNGEVKSGEQKNMYYYYESENGEKIIFQ